MKNAAQKNGIDTDTNISKVLLRPKGSIVLFVASACIYILHCHALDGRARLCMVRENRTIMLT